MNVTNVKHIQLVQHFVLSTPTPNLITPNLILRPIDAAARSNAKLNS